MNRLAGETSPYLLQHADNPVDWYPWGDEAFARARDEDRPILLSVGYSACHWCHVMAHESFEDPATAAVMNEHFVNVKVDREERPDVDAVYMEATVAMSGSGGWPMTVFLTPAGEPFYAGTYFPPEPRHGMPSFRQLLAAVAEAWRERRDDVGAQARTLVDAIGESARIAPSSEPLTAALLVEAESASPAPSIPSTAASAVRPSFRRRRRSSSSCGAGRIARSRWSTKTLDAMAAGGMYDLVGGGFHRYSVDERWLVPHFEKMLYDNALLAPAYLHAWLVTGKERHREIVEETLEYMLRELALEGGGLASAQDADTDGVEGLTYTWTPEEAAAVGLDPALLLPFEHGRLIVRGVLDRELRARLLAVRPSVRSRSATTRRSPRGTGSRSPRSRTRATARAAGLGRGGAWGGGVPARAALRRRRAASVAPGGTAASPVTASSTTTPTSPTACSSCTSRRARCAGCTRRGASRCSRSSCSATASAAASSSRRRTARRSSRARSRSTTTRRRRATRCSPTCCCGSRGIWGDDELERQAVGVLRLVEPSLAACPAAFGWALCALDLWLAPPQEIAIVGAGRERGRRGPRWRRSARAPSSPSARPTTCRCSPARASSTGEPAVYVCERFACQAPVTDPADL